MGDKAARLKRQLWDGFWASPQLTEISYLGNNLLMKTSTKNDTCFISAPAGADLTTLLDVLQDYNFQILHPSDLPSGGLTLIEKVINVIKHSDLMIAILGTAQVSANVMFELGCASSLGKRVVVIATEGNDIPTDLQSLLYIRTDLDNREALSFAIDLILSAPEQTGTDTSPMGEKTQPLGREAQDLRRQLNALGPEPHEQQLISIVQQMLEISGISIRAEPKYEKLRPDLAVWVDELDPYFGNPIIIEVKRRIETVADARNFTDRVLQYSVLSDTRTVLIFTLEVFPVAMKIVEQYPNLYFFNLPSFLDRLQNESFGKIIRDERNARVHGRPR